MLKVTINTYNPHVWSLWLEANICRVFYCLFMPVLMLEIQLSRGREEGVCWVVVIPLPSLIPSHFCACPKPRPRCPSAYVMTFLCSVIWGEVHFVDIGGIVDQPPRYNWTIVESGIKHHNAWPSLFKFLFIFIVTGWTKWPVKLSLKVTSKWMVVVLDTWD